MQIHGFILLYYHIMYNDDVVNFRMLKELICLLNLLIIIFDHMSRKRSVVVMR
jgi:hypothetical protein